MLEEIGLSCEQERAVLEFACDIVLMPYNRRTSRPLIAIVNFVKSIKQEKQPTFEFPIRKAFKWWWAFCKKYSVISLYYKEKSQNANVPIFEAEEQKSAKNTVVGIGQSKSGSGSSSEPMFLSTYPLFYYPSPYLYALSDLSSTNTSVQHVK